MATKNIFELLPDSDAEDTTQQDAKKPAQKSDNKKEKPQAAGSQQKSKEAAGKTSSGAQPKDKTGEKRPYPNKRPQGGNYSLQYVARPDEGNKEKKHEKSDREGPKPFKGVPAEPHPMDRKSGTGRGKEVSKSGAGRRNWGTPSDDLNEDKVERVEENERQKEEVLETVQEEVKPEVVEYTLEEYYNKKGLKAEKKEDKKPETKKIDYSQGKLEGLEIVKPKEIQADKGKQPKQQNKEASHKLALDSENSELLGFKTGLVLYQPRPPKKNFERDEQEPREKPEENAENQGEGGRKPAGPARGGHRGGKRDDGHKRDSQPREFGRKKEVMPNLENEKDFPSLG